MYRPDCRGVNKKKQNVVLGTERKEFPPVIVRKPGNKNGKVPEHRDVRPIAGGEKTGGSNVRKRPHWESVKGGLLENPGELKNKRSIVRKSFRVHRKTGEDEKVEKKRLLPTPRGNEKGNFFTRGGRFNRGS